MSTMVQAPLDSEYEQIKAESPLDSINNNSVSDREQEETQAKQHADAVLESQTELYNKSRELTDSALQK